MTPDFLTNLGGPAKCLELATAFYNRVDDDPILRPLFPGKSHRCAIEHFAAFLVFLTFAGFGVGSVP